MGVYINMEMPNNCCGCEFSAFTPTGTTPFCRRTGKDLAADVYFNKRDSECPLVPVPPHGRLGDLDALIEKVIAKYLEHERKGELVFAAAEIKQDIVDLISDAPTIIPAEEKKV